MFNAKKQAKIRDSRIELLRLFAMFGIVFFHFYHNYFADLTQNFIYDTGISSPMLFILSAINILGAMGNHIFIIIAGYFLLPKLLKVSPISGLKICLNRSLKILFIIWGWMIALSVVGTIIKFGHYNNIFSIDGWKFILLPETASFVWMYFLFIFTAPVMALIYRFFKNNKFAIVAFFSFCAIIWSIAIFTAFANKIYGFGLFGENQIYYKILTIFVYLISFITGGIINAKQKIFIKFIHKIWKPFAFCVFFLMIIFAFSRNIYALQLLSYNSFGVICFVFALILFGLFLSAKPLKNKIINRTATGVLALYIVQCGTWGGWYNAWAIPARNLPEPLFLLSGIIYATIFTVCILSVNFAWQKTKPFLKIWLGKVL